MARYKATTAMVYLCNEGRLILPGEEFSFDGPVGSTWECLDEPTPRKRKAADPDPTDG